MAPHDLSSPPSTPSLFQQALARLRRGGKTAGGAALAGGMLLQLPAIGACVDGVDHASAEQADWAQYEGHRNTDLVSFTGDWWQACKQPNTRFGCGSIDVTLKLRVRPVHGASLDGKRVGVIYKTPFEGHEQTALGRYVTTWGDGDEEWHVTVNLPSWQTTILFNSWYQDGAGGTWYDDNQGELHVVNAGPDHNVIRVEPWLGTVTVGDAGVQGRISVQLTDLDYDKELVLVCTKDGWSTVIELGIGAHGDVNKWTWVEDYPWSARERWQIDLDLPGPADRFEYAVVYRHGVVPGARRYAFWDNNYGWNYHVVRSDLVE